MAGQLAFFDPPPPPLTELEQGLAAFLAEAGFRGHWSFSPHITLLYTDWKIPDQHIDPISWAVNEFVLIHSAHGETTHNLLQRFPQRG
jgi:RNA 2',3'-cyclic 3'-phosphodiesterase